MSGSFNQKKLLPYALGPVIARGGMAEVYIARKITNQFQKVVAIKRILPHYAFDRDFIAMLRQEAQISSQLQHSNIVQVFDFGYVEGSIGLVMEFIDGCDLRALLSNSERQNTRIEVPAAIYIAAEVASGLHFVHNARNAQGQDLSLVHRDISPQNVLISWGGKIKVIDFGIADSKDNNDETKPGVVKGKYSYMSPEQVSGKPLGPKSDIFSLGIVLWETLAMERLFNSNSELETMKRIHEVQIDTALIKCNPQVNPELQSVILRALNKSEDGRYSNAQEFSVTLRRYLQTNYPQWTPENLGNFATKVMAKQKQELQKSVQIASNLRELKPVSTGASAITYAPQSYAQGIRKQKTNRPRHTQSRQPRYQKTNTISAINTISNSATLRTALGVKTSSAVYHYFRDHILIGLTLVVAVCLIGMAYLLPEVPSFRTFKFMLRSKPQYVKVSIDREPQFKDRYVKTPVNLSVPSGAHIISISREGFETIDVPVTGSFGEQLNSALIKLRPQPRQGFVRLNIRMAKPDQRGVKVIVDQGQYSGSLPAKIDFLLPGREIMILVQPQKGGRFRCRIKTPDGDRSQQTDVQIQSSLNGKSRCVVRRVR
jgi:serine/threonine protein kinase